ncbi:unnamed protein product [Prorocentrum cordatum]|uniref:GPI ethanolamine phosphate transferase 1 n=1 Tax=Prorocentrum cordatum TaxID=2364126 RepID=A0ABN9STQ6_9DINO|nr:unnamed protein product [Polarella glacialis]
MGGGLLPLSLWPKLGGSGSRGGRPKPIAQQRAASHAMRTCSFIVLLILLTLITLAATTSKYWVHWLSVTIMVGMLFLANLMFMDDSAFVFDPLTKKVDL